MSEITPALTPDQWRQRSAAFEKDDRDDDASPDKRTFHLDDSDQTGDLVIACDDCDGGTMVRREQRHAVAALALYNMPFGFTWEMVDAILAADTRMTDVAYRIAALLPPRG